MARIAGVNLPIHKHTVIALTYIFGIGKTRASLICEKTNVDPQTKVNQLSEAELQTVREAVAEYTIEGDLRREISTNIRRLQEIGCYRGIRHRKNLPLRGQRTKTNARTRKGVKKPIRK